MSQKFINTCIEDSKKQSYTSTLQSITSSRYPMILKLRLLEGLRQQLRVKVKQLSNLSQYVQGEYKQQKHQDTLWEEIDQIETQILQTKNQKIKLQLQKEDLEEKYQEEEEEYKHTLKQKQIILGQIIDQVSKVSGSCSRTKFHSKESDDEQQISTVDH